MWAALVAREVSLLGGISMYDIPAKWYPEWFAWGIKRFEEYLEVHARFEEWLLTREDPSTDIGLETQGKATGGQGNGF